MTHVRVLVHALDRTGPPMLARSLMRWASSHRAGITLETVAFRGGPLVDDFAAMGPVHVLLHPEEAWDHDHPDPTRAGEIRSALGDLAASDVSLLVSVAAGQCLSLLPDDRTPITTWVVEQGEDLHWLDAPVDVAGRTDHWLAGSRGTADELRHRLEPGADIDVAREFIENPPVDPERRARRRAELAGVDRAGDEAMVVVGAGIGTWRKAPDLFLEVALAHRRLHGPGVRFVWIGGESDPLVPKLEQATDQLGIGDLVRWLPNTDALDEYLAAADLMVHPARLDSFPLVCLQAAAVGTPVVAFSGVGGVPEMFGPQFAGVTYPDVEGLADLVESLRAPGARESLGAAQRDRVLSNFVSDVAAAPVFEHLERVLDETCPGDRGSAGGQQ